MVAASPDTLPSYALLSNGVTALSDTGVVNPTSSWSGAPEVFKTQAVAITGSRSPQLQWTVSPVADYTQLEAMRCACRWVLAGPEEADPASTHILADPETDTSPGPHFGVAWRLAKLSPGWLHVGRLRDIPLGARYKDHCGDTWVWVMPDGTESLAEFTLVLQDIATLNVAPSDGSAPAHLTPPLLVTLWVVQNTLQKPQPVMITIERNGDGTLGFRNADKSTGAAVVTVGQSVIWRNKDNKAHSATSKIKGLFDTDKIDGLNDSKAILFDDAMYSAAGGRPGGEVALSYSSTVDGDKGEGQIILKADTASNLYSQTLVFRVDRVVKPEFKEEIERRMNRAIAQKPPQPVAITWDEWMAMTTPFQGQRTSVKPGASTATPITLTRPNTRLVPPAGTGLFYGTSARPTVFPRSGPMP
jgi:hypothetical protein